MACPLFLPASPLPRSLAGAASLGDWYAGECAADPGSGAIGGEMLRRCCNTGYARGSCPHAAQSEADAFRFLIKADRDGVVDVAWSSERNHHPVAVGTLAVPLAGSGENRPLDLQARAYAAAYLRQTGR